VQARLAAVRAGELDGGAGEADAGAVAAVVDLPLGREEPGQRVAGEVVGGAVRAGDDAQGPAVGELGEDRRQFGGGIAVLVSAYGQHVARCKGSSELAAEAAEQERRSAAEHARDRDAAAYRQVGAQPAGSAGTEFEH